MPKSRRSCPATRTVPASAAAARINLRSSVVGSRRRSCHVDGWCAAHGLRWARLFFMAVLSALGSPALFSSGAHSQRSGNLPSTTDVVRNTEGKNSGSDPPGVGSPQSPHSLFDRIGPAGPALPPRGAMSAMLSPGMALPCRWSAGARISPLLPASRVRVGDTRRLGNRVIAKPFCVEGAG